jgi:transposase
MIGSTRALQVYAYSKVTDMRKGYEGLGALVRQKLQGDPLSGDLYLFVNRRRNRAKVLLYDGTGMCIYMKRLDKGLFAAPWGRGDGESLRLTVSELALFLEGSELVFWRPLSPEPLPPPEMRVAATLR